ncbi:hemolysin XhlA family protein [Bacillus cereus]|uniref:Hemolysin XhlA family protein n=1 Tax=Bacillus cereus TaxID=1396 RepID=A0AAW4R4L7_BACCE|nr:hemolysin XhlA family protein [Bacillus cereus]MBY0040958.1 hemolysin XhlA family protein [Bacillus cereus]
MEDLNKKIEELALEQKDIMGEIRNLEMRTTINEKDISTINKQLEKISLNTTWILRIMIGAVVTGVFSFLIKGIM